MELEPILRTVLQHSFVENAVSYDPELRYFAVDPSVAVLLHASVILEVLHQRRFFCQRPCNHSCIMEDFRLLCGF